VRERQAFCRGTVAAALLFVGCLISVSAMAGPVLVEFEGTLGETYDPFTQVISPEYIAKVAAELPQGAHYSGSFIYDLSSTVQVHPNPVSVVYPYAFTDVNFLLSYAGLPDRTYLPGHDFASVVDDVTSHTVMDQFNITFDLQPQLTDPSARVEAIFDARDSDGHLFQNDSLPDIGELADIMSFRLHVLTDQGPVLVDSQLDRFTVTPLSVSEPATVALFLAGFAYCLRRRHKA
jgi:hypothetical protein